MRLPCSPHKRLPGENLAAATVLSMSGLCLVGHITSCACAAALLCRNVSYGKCVFAWVMTISIESMIDPVGVCCLHQLCLVTTRVLP